MASTIVTVVSDCLRLWQNGDVKQLADLLAVGCKVNARTVHGSTPLMVAAKDGHIDLVDALLLCNADLNSQDVSENTALMLASKGGHWRCVQSLLYSWSADLDKKNETGSTALILTTSALSKEGHVHCVKYLVEQDADLDIKNDMGMTALMYCVDSPGFGLPALKILIEAGAEVNIVNDDGESLLMLAVRRSHLPIVDYLLMLKDVDIHLVNNDWDNALIIALKLMTDNSKIIDSLLRAGSDPNSKSGSGCSALNIAAAANFDKTRLLLSNGAVPKLSQIVYMPRASDTYRSLQACGSIFTPMDVAVLNGNFSTANFLLTFLGCRPFPLFDSYTSISFNRRSESGGNLEAAVSEMIAMAGKCPGWIEKVRMCASRPRSLLQFCIPCISEMTGSGPGRRDRLIAAGLPPMLVKLVMLDDIDEEDFILCHS